MVKQYLVRRDVVVQADNPKEAIEKAEEGEGVRRAPVALKLKLRGRKK